jgi:hypothetical protein
VRSRGWLALLMAVEIRVFLAMAAFSQKAGTVFAFAWMLRLSPREQPLDSKCYAFGIGGSGTRSMLATAFARAAKRAS